MLNLQLPFSSLGRRMVFAMDDGVHGIEPWITNGTPNGTRLLRDVCPGSCGAGFNSFNMAVAGQLLFFTATDGWRSGGTPASTRLLADLNE